MDPWLHGDVICRFLEENSNRDLMFLLPRGCGKSGMITVPFPAYQLAKNPLGGVIVCNATEEKAAKMAAASAAIITGNTKYRQAYPYIRPSPRNWGTRGYSLDFKKVKNEEDGSIERIDAAIGSYGVRGNITGAHLGGIVHDDLINQTISKSPKELETVEKFYAESLNCLDLGSPLIICGTRWSYNDYYGKLETGELGGKEDAVKTLKLGVTYKCPKGEEYLIWPSKTYVDMGVNKTVGYTKKMVAQSKKTLGTLFSALYYNEPVLAEDIAFDIDLINIYKEATFPTGPVAAVAVEAESQGNALISTIRMLMKQQNRRFGLKPINSGRVKKEERIRSTLQPLIRGCELCIRDHDWRRDKGLGYEFRTFPKGDDDALDALTYLSALCKTNPSPGSLPFIYIVVDPAFTDKSHSDSTAIVAGCRYEDKLWVLSCEKFKTDRTDVITERIFATYDRFQHGAGAKRRSYSMKMKGYSSKKKRGPGKVHPVEFDLPQ